MSHHSPSRMADHAGFPFYKIDIPLTLAMKNMQMKTRKHFLAIIIISNNNSYLQLL